MRIGKALLLGIASAAMVAAAAAPAMAASGPSGPPQTQTGTIQIPQTLQLTLTGSSAFTLTGSNTNSLNAAGGGPVEIMSNDSSGYFVDVTGPTAFVAPGVTPTIPTADVSLGSYDPMSTLTSSAQEWVHESGVSGTQGNDDSAGPAGWDTFSFSGYWLNTTPTAPVGNYAGTISWVLWGN